jgi:DNA-binding YbaB/EbfC family protein
MMPGMPDLQSLLQQAQQMQADMARAQSDLAEVEVTGHSGGGLVTATVSGDGQLKALVIDPSVVDPADVETLADLVIAAVRDASRSAAELAEQSLGSVANITGPGGPGGFDLSAFGLPSLDGLLDDDDDDDDEFEDELDEDGDDPVGKGVDGPIDGVGIDTEELNDMVDADVVDAEVPDAGFRPPSEA